MQTTQTEGLSIFFLSTSAFPTFIRFLSHSIFSFFCLALSSSFAFPLSLSVSPFLTSFLTKINNNGIFSNLKDQPQERKQKKKERHVGRATEKFNTTTTPDISQPCSLLMENKNASKIQWTRTIRMSCHLCVREWPGKNHLVVFHSQGEIGTTL